MTTTFFVDDSDTRIQYNGNSWKGLGNPDLEYQETTHRTTAKSDGFSFAFNGTKVGVYGTIRKNQTSTPIQCLIDGPADVWVNQGITAPSDRASYQQLFCEADLSDDKEHNLTVVLTEDAMGAVSPFYLDYIAYEIPRSSHRDVRPLPLAEDPISVVVDDRETDQITYVGEWEQSGSYPAFQNTTQGASLGSSAEFRFTGTKVAVYGTVANESGTQATATFRIDDGPVVNRTTSKYSTLLLPARHLQFYQSPDLVDGNHTLFVTYASGPVKYWIDFFTYSPSPLFGLVSTTPESSRHASTPSVEPPGSSTSSASSEPGSSDHSLSTGATAGIAVGGAAVLILAAAIALLLKKRKGSRQASYHHDQQPEASSGLHTTQVHHVRSDQAPNQGVSTVNSVYPTPFLASRPEGYGRSYTNFSKSSWTHTSSNTGESNQTHPHSSTSKRGLGVDSGNEISLTSGPGGNNMAGATSRESMERPPAYGL